MDGNNAGALAIPEPPDGVKLTLDLGFVDLRSINLLVRDRFLRSLISSARPSATSSRTMLTPRKGGFAADA